MKTKYYSLKNILEKNARYNVIFGERSNGKTYSVLEYALRKYAETGEQAAIVRRWQDDFKQKRAAVMYDGHVANGLVEKLFKGKWTGITYSSMRWYLYRTDEDGKRIVSEEPIAYAFAISSYEHDKSTSYPKIRTILFDEFLTRDYYLDDEFVKFMNVCSTIIRLRNDVKIFMLGNTVNKYCPYFKEMGLTHIKDMKKGSIEVYTYGDSELRVAVEYSDNPAKVKDSDVYFAFDNPKLSMITGGEWEIDIYPHCPIKYAPKDIIYTFFISFDGTLLQCEIVSKDINTFVFIHEKTTELKHPERDLIYSTEYDARPNWRRNLLKPFYVIEKKITSLFKQDKIFYQSNDIGEVVNNYLKWCETN